MSTATDTDGDWEAWHRASVREPWRLVATAADWAGAWRALDRFAGGDKYVGPLGLGPGATRSGRDRR